MICQHFGTCGGCSLQDIPYLEQLKLKQQQIETLFKSPVNPIISCDQYWHHRNKMEFSFGRDNALGLYKKGSNRHIVDLQTCYMCPEWFMDVVATTRSWQRDANLKNYHYHTNRGDLRTLTLRHGMRTDEKMAILTVSGDASLSDEVIEQWRLSLPSDVVPILRRHHIKKGTPTRLEEIPLNGKSSIEDLLCLPDQTLRFSISSQSFFQPNPRAAEKLYAEALELLALEPHDTLIDLFCGTATLSLFAAKLVKQVIGVEINPQAVQDARNNITHNGITNVQIIQGDAAQILPSLPPSSALLVDPPRCGLGEKALNLILSLRPQKLLYISCNPSTQAPEVQALINAGYSLKTLQPLDQFPHTPHCENMALLIAS